MAQDTQWKRTRTLAIDTDAIGAMKMSLFGDGNKIQDWSMKMLGDSAGSITMENLFTYEPTSSFTRDT